MVLLSPKAPAHNSFGQKGNTGAVSEGQVQIPVLVAMIGSASEMLSKVKDPRCPENERPNYRPVSFDVYFHAHP